MEKTQDSVEEHKYLIDTDIIWRETMNDDRLPFKNVIPALKEQTQDELK